MSWGIINEKLLKTAKFIKTGTVVIIQPTDPIKTTVDGKYGKREMYIVETREYGLIYVSPTQFLKIAALFKNDFSSGITVEL